MVRAAHMSRPGGWGDARIFINSYDERLLSPCCRMPQMVALGELVTHPDGEWSQRVDHLCSSCGQTFDPHHPNVLLTTPEGTE